MTSCATCGLPRGRGFEKDVEWYRSNRDLPDPGFCDLRLYSGWPAARPAAEAAVRRAEAVLIGSLVPDGQTIIDWLVRQNRPLLFYDIDTPIILVDLRKNQRTDYLRADQVPLFDVYFSFAGGPALTELEHRWRSQRAEVLYCGVDTLVYRPVRADPPFECTLSYMGTYTPDRQSAVEELLLAPARIRSTERFGLAGPQYPPVDFPPNLHYAPHVYPCDHAAFFGSSRATLSLTRQAMRVRLGTFDATVRGRGRRRLHHQRHLARIGRALRT